MMGLDIVKNVLTAHAIDHTGEMLFHKKLSCFEPAPFFASITVSIVAMMACGGAHHWAWKWDMQSNVSSRPRKKGPRKWAFSLK